jgi:hypothetical protein
VYRPTVRILYGAWSLGLAGQNLPHAFLVQCGDAPPPPASRPYCWISSHLRHRAALESRPSGTPSSDQGNLKTSFNGTFHAFNYDKVARRYLGGYCFRFNRRFSMAAMTERIANAVCCCMPCTERDLRVAEAYG